MTDHRTHVDWDTLADYMDYCGDIPDYEAYDIRDLIRCNGGSITHSLANKLLSPWGGWDPQWMDK